MTGLTVILKVLVLAPVLVVQVIVAEPIPIAVTRPFASTEATLELLVDQLTDLSVALLGVIAAVKVWVLPTLIVAEPLIVTLSGTAPIFKNFEMLREPLPAQLV